MSAFQHDQTQNELTVNEPSATSTTRSSPLPIPSGGVSLPFVSSPPTNLDLSQLGFPSTPTTSHATWHDDRPARRPSLSRHISSPAAHSSSYRSTPRGEHTSTFANLTRRFSKYAGTPPTAAPEWTVFGQIMAQDERPVGLSPRPNLTSRMSQRMPSSRSVPHVATVSEEEDIENGVPSVLQSPVSDPELVRHFPTPMYGDTPAASTSYEPSSAGEEEEGSDEEGNSSDSSSSSSTIRSRNDDRESVPWYSWSRVPTMPVLYRNILKCSIAYFVASLFTYNDFLSGLITQIISGNGGKNYPSPSGHMVATVYVLSSSTRYILKQFAVPYRAVYFNPAKTLGGMLEADRYCLAGLAFAAFVSLGSMNMYWWLEHYPSLDWLADILVILWIGLGMSTVAWMKLWMAKPTFNTGVTFGLFRASLSDSLRLG